MMSVPSNPDELIATVIFWLGLIFLLAMVGRCLARCLNQPAVLGELLIGILFGNLCYYFNVTMIVVLREGAALFSVIRDTLAGLPLASAVKQTLANPFYAQQVTAALSGSQGMDHLRVAYALDLFSRFGVIFLLFRVGLDSSLEDLKRTGREALQVALLGVLAPIVLGFIVAYLLIPEAGYKANLFVAATLSATSIGITARVLAEMKTLQTREASTILGAAMIDDILGLIILAMVSSIVISGHINLAMIAQEGFMTLLFFGLSLFLSPFLLSYAAKCTGFLDAWEAKLMVSFLFALLLAWLATLVQLAAIVGAFLAGMIIHDNYFKSKAGFRNLSIKELVSPLEFLLAPLFFMLMGIQVKLETFFHQRVFLMALGLLFAAILGKLVSGLAASKRSNRLFIGIGMLPRGEVGLIFASIGRTLGVISDELFSAIILMVMVTTLIVPPLLARCLKKDGLHNET